MSSAEADTANTRHAHTGLTRFGAVARVVLTVSLVLPLLAACGNGGFRPLYGQSDLGGGAASEKLALLDIAPIPGRVGQRIRNELIFQSTGGGQPIPPAYRLEIIVRESTTSSLVRLDGEAQSNTYNLDAAFRVVRISDKSVMLEGTSYGRAAFDRVDSIFANVRAQQDAQDRAAGTVATDLKSRLAAYLATAA